jgi:hypothetical protein
MIDNFEIISSLLNFTNPKSFYFMQVLKRRKENPELKSNSIVINNYYLYDKGDLEKLRERIIDDCTKNNARAYINVNTLDLEKIAMFTMQKTVELVIKGDYKAVKNAYASTCGSHHSEENKRWVIDIDTKDRDFIDKVRGEIETLQAEIKNNQYKILAEVLTKNGVHIITNPFNLKKFQDKELGVDVHKNNPTILYIS